MKIELFSVTRPSQSLSSSEGKNDKSATETFYKGDPEYDECVKESLALKEKGRLMFEQENGLPKNFLSPMSEGVTHTGLQLCVQVKSVFESLYRMDIDERALEDTLSDVVADIRAFYISEGYDETEFMPKLLEDVYDMARLSNINGAGVASWYDGLPLAAEQNGHDRDTKDWVYYDSDYYYRSEEMKGSLINMIQRIATRYQVEASDLNLQTEYPANDVRNGIYSSYNAYINHSTREEHRIGSIIDETMVPPKGFRFFYKSNEAGTNLWVPTLDAPQDEPEAAFDGVLQVWYGDWYFVGRVPVRQNPYEFPISVNMFDVVSAGSKAPIPTEITDFLHNMDFFTTTQSQTYAQSHPRRF